MEAILFKSVPIYYSKSKILYFDAIKEYDSSSFHYLEKTNNWNPMARVASHKIDFKKHVSELNRINEKNSLQKVVIEIFEMAESKTLKFGYPIAFNESGEIKTMNEHELNEMSWRQKEAQLINTIVTPFVSSSSFKGLLSVGQGLSYLDEANGFIYDAGGGSRIKYNQYKTYLGGSSYNIVISHMHYDHYKFLPNLFKDGKVNMVYLPRKIFVGKRLNKFLDRNTVNISIVDAPITVCGYNIKVPSSTSVRESDVNSTSLLADGNDWLLTGDSTWKIIEDTYIFPIVSKNISVPHHGSKTAGMVNASMFIGSKKFHVSHGAKKIYGHPDGSIMSNLEKFGVVNDVIL